MILSDVFDRYVKKSPVSVMARALMEVALAPEDLDALFEKHTDRQYTRSLLPGHSLVVLDPELMLATDMIPCEDGHAQERSLSPEILKLVKERNVWIADRNFCTTVLLLGIAAQDAFFVIRQHAN